MIISMLDTFRMALHTTHGSWLVSQNLNRGILPAQCLDRVIPDKPTLSDEIGAWQQERNANHTKSDRHCTTGRSH